MKLHPDSTQAAIVQNTTDKVYQRGVDYYEQGAVVSAVRRGGLLQAEVEGSEDEPYLVFINVGAKGIQDADCTCPYMAEWDGWCKHIVAALLFCLNTPDDVEERPTLRKLLDGLDQKQLHALLQDLAAEDPRLIAAIEERVVSR